MSDDKEYFVLHEFGAKGDPEPEKVSIVSEEKPNHNTRARNKRFNTLIDNKKKPDALNDFRGNIAHSIPEEQSQKIVKTIKKAPGGKNATVTLEQSKQSGNIRVILKRDGKVNGYQKFSHDITSTGERLRVVQTAYDGEGNLVHQRPGEPKNNLFDIKK